MKFGVYLMFPGLTSMPSMSQYKKTINRMLLSSKTVSTSYKVESSLYGMAVCIVGNNKTAVELVMSILKSHLKTKETEYGDLNISFLETREYIYDILLIMLGNPTRVGEDNVVEFEVEGDNPKVLEYNLLAHTLTK